MKPIESKEGRRSWIDSLQGGVAIKRWERKKERGEKKRENEEKERREVTSQLRRERETHSIHTTIGLYTSIQLNM